MATCSECIHLAKCLIDETTRYYGKDIACANVEELCKFFKNKSNFVEVVRCRDCKHYYESYYADGKVFRREGRLRSTGCGYGDVLLKTNNGYCSFGERKADNER